MEGGRQKKEGGRAQGRGKLDNPHPRQTVISFVFPPPMGGTEQAGGGPNPSNERAPGRHSTGGGRREEGGAGVFSVPRWEERVRQAAVEVICFQGTHLATTTTRDDA